MKNESSGTASDRDGWKCCNAWQRTKHRRQKNPRAEGSTRSAKPALTTTHNLNLFHVNLLNV